ncbi:MAG: response regulator [Bacteroidota bacterium]
MTFLSTTAKYALLGVLFGFLFPAASVTYDLFHNQLPFTQEGLSLLFANQVLHWVIASAPLFLGFFAYLIGRKQSSLENYSQGLERKVEERTAYLEKKNQELFQEISQRKKVEQQLRDAKEKAEEASKAKAQFLSTMSHEIRTPLNAMIGMTGLLVGTELDEEQQDFVKTVRMGGEALLSIINDILDYSKIESGKLELEKEPFEINEPIEDTLELLSAKAHEKGLELMYYVHEEVPAAILSDITRLRQILVNLVNNAIKFTHQGEIYVSVKHISYENNLHTLQFSVKDTGIGIPEDKIQRLFTSFSQVDASTTRKYGGTGLGLAICKKLTELMGGSIWVESEYQKGSSFHFTIQAPEASAKETYKQMASHLFKGERVLLLDDNATNLKILKIQCEKWGLETFQTTLPHTALDILSHKHKFDLAIFDMNMPELSGSALAHLVKKSPFSKDLPLIMLSSAYNVESESDKEVFSSFISKPARAAQLFHAISRGLNPEKETSSNKKKTTNSFEKPNLVPLKILLAEDNPVNQRVAGKMLQKLGLEIEVASNGLEAVEAVKMVPYDLILMDMQMPEMDGISATRQIISGYLKRPSEKRPLIFAMTANAMKEDREACMQAGMDDFLAKPVRMEALRGILEKWFSAETV